MASSGGRKFGRISGLAPGKSASRHWNNATAEVYALHVWPVVPTGQRASGEITKVKYVVHGSPPERELHYTVKNTGTSTADFDVWALWWNE